MKTYKHIQPGARFGKLTVLGDSALRSNGRRLLLCVCECGEECLSLSSLLSGGRKRSCGCLAKQNNIRHGDGSKRNQAAEYTAWTLMKSRCKNPRNNRWAIYGGRGIKVCARWQDSYESFLADMGRKTSPAHSIDRIAVNGNYEPGNCRWATASEQALNRRPRPKKVSRT